MEDLTKALLYAAMAGATIPLGGLAACVESVQPYWHRQELRHSVVAFGGGVLVAAVALVLVPEGERHLSALPALAAFGAGGVAFFAVDRLIERRGGAGAQLLAMLLDFLPESLALGALLAAGQPAALLLAILIALQNLPEGFNAFREIRAGTRRSPSLLIAAFAGIALLGPVMAWLGFTYLRDLQALLGAIMLFAAGGILYLTFQDIAPQARLERHWAPALAANAGFMLGLLGHVTIGA